MLSEELQVYLLVLHCFSKALSFAGAKPWPLRLNWANTSLITTTTAFSVNAASSITLPPTASQNETFIGGSHNPLSNFAISKAPEGETDQTGGDKLFEPTGGLHRIRGQNDRNSRHPFSRGTKPKKQNKLFEKASRKLFELLKDSSEFQRPQHRPGLDPASAELLGPTIRGPARNRLRHHHNRHHQRTKSQFSQDPQAVDASQLTDGVGKVSQPYAIMSGKRLTPEFCRAEPFKQRIHARGCRSQTFVNNYCYGHCHSFFVPQAYRKLTAAFQTSPCCRPRETRRAEIFLDCPRRRHRKQIRKVVVKIVSCVCTSQCD